MSYDTIRFEISDKVAVLTLDRPDKLNCFNLEMHGEIRAALDGMEADGGARALVITGAGRAFCTGQDLADRISIMQAGETVNPRESLDTNYNPLAKRLRDMKMPVISAVNGPAAGAGCNFALAADIVIAARSANFIQSFANIGLVPDCGGTYWLPRLVGDARARALVITGDPLDAETAAEWGLIWKCVDDEVLMDEVMALAGHLANRPTTGIGLAKQALNESSTNDLAAQLDLERDLQVEACKTKDFVEGVTAFLEKRPARFVGR